MLLFLLSFILFSSSLALADDDDDEEKDNEKSQTISSSSSSSSITKMVTQTIIIEPAKTVTSVIMKDVVLADSDRDGIPDEQDIYPNVPNHLIVDDFNLDGIDDRLELENIQE